MNHYLHKHRSKYVGCAVAGCTNGCTVEVLAALAGGNHICVPGCEEHAAQIFEIKQELEGGIEPKDIALVVDTRDKKSTVGVSLSELYLLETTQITNETSPQEQIRAQQITVVENWKWIDDFDMWMNAAGNVVTLRELEDKELEDAVLLIRHVNIQRRTKRIRWIKDLEDIAPPIKYAYPEDELAVGMEEAYSKLDEFYEEYRSRGILP